MTIITFIFFLFSLFLSGCSPRKLSQTSLTTPTPPPATQDELGEALRASPSPSSPSVSASVPLPTGEDIVRVFFELINEKRIPDAIAMLDPAIIPDDSAKQAWGVSFNHFKSVKAEKIEEYNKSSWTETLKTYKVTLNIQTDAPAEQIIWENGINIRWVDLKKVGNLWKITGFASGP